MSAVLPLLIRSCFRELSVRPATCLCVARKGLYPEQSLILAHVSFTPHPFQPSKARDVLKKLMV